MSAKYLIDTNTAIFFFKGHQTVIDHWMKTSPSEVKMASITFFELCVGATTSTKPGERLSQLKVMQNNVEVVNFTTKEGEVSARIKAQLKSIGMGIGPLDTLIAGTALAHNLILVTNNTKEFSRVNGLDCIDWTRP